MRPEQIQEVRDWTMRKLKDLETSNPSSFPKETKMLQRILILTTEVPIEDTQLRKYAESLEIRIQTINDRTKKHTIEIKNLEKAAKTGSAK